MADTSSQIHATAIAFADRRCALILGAPGSGKSDLALRCIMQGAWIDGQHHAATLVADDQVIVERQNACLVARAPPTIAGRIEVRGMGIVATAYLPAATVALVVMLVRDEAIERFPDPQPTYDLLGLRVPLLRVAPFEASAHLKVLLALVRGLPST